MVLVDECMQEITQLDRKITEWVSVNMVENDGGSGSYRQESFFQSWPSLLLSLCHSSYCIFTCVVDMSYMVYFNFFCCLLLPLVAMFIIYGHIFLTVRRQLKRIAMASGTAKHIRASGSGSTGTEVTGSSVVGTSTGGEPDTETGRETSEDKKRECQADMRAGEEVKSGVGSLIETDTTAVFTKPGLRIDTGSAPRQSNMGKSKVSTRQELRKAISFFLVLFLFMVCWMPIHIINCILLFCPQCNVPMTTTLGTILLSHANSALNPILYAYRMRSFRHTLIGMWKGMWCVRPKHH